MAIRFEKAHAVLDGHCTVEEAHYLATWLAAEPDRKLDLSACTGLHAAVLQCLMALRPAVVAAPADTTLARWLAPVIALPSDSPKPPARRRRSRKPAATASPRTRRRASVPA